MVEVFKSHTLFCDDEPAAHIAIDPCSNIIAFRIQDGPIKEVGVNGCQVDHVILFARLLLSRFNHAFPCKENELADEQLEGALYYLQERKKSREARGVEGRESP